MCMYVENSFHRLFFIIISVPPDRGNGHLHKPICRKNLEALHIPPVSRSRRKPNWMDFPFCRWECYRFPPRKDRWDRGIRKDFSSRSQQFFACLKKAERLLCLKWVLCDERLNIANLLYKYKERGVKFKWVEGNCYNEKAPQGVRGWGVFGSQ